MSVVNNIVKLYNSNVNNVLTLHVTWVFVNLIEKRRSLPTVRGNKSQLISVQTLMFHAVKSNANEGRSAAAKVRKGRLFFATVMTSVGNVWEAWGAVLFVT